MGRKKIDTDRKLPKGKINSTFTKRKQGAVNKAKQLGKLCDVDVALIAFHPRNDAVIAVSHGGRVDDIISRYKGFKEAHLEKVQFSEELRTMQQPHQLQPHQLQTNQMHPNHMVNTHVPHMEIGVPVSQQQQGFSIQAQGTNGSPNGPQQLNPQGQFLPPARPHDFGPIYDGQ